MKEVASRDNPSYKRLVALAQSTQRQRRDGVALLEGAHLAQAWLEAFGQPTRCVATAHALTHPETRALIERVDAARVLLLSDALFERISPVVRGLGLLFVVTIPAPAAPRASSNGRGCVVLDGLQDAGNVGSILRSAAAAGIDQVICMPGTAYAWSTKVLRAAMGAHFLLQIVEGEAAQAAAARLTLPVAVTDSHAATSLYDCDLTVPVAWVFGNEGAGVSADWRARAAHRLVIPQPGAMESLNVAAAAAICLFEQCRQRHGSATATLKRHAATPVAAAASNISN